MGDTFRIAGTCIGKHSYSLPHNIQATHRAKPPNITTASTWVRSIIRLTAYESAATGLRTANVAVTLRRHHRCKFLDPLEASSPGLIFNAVIDEAASLTLDDACCNCHGDSGSSNSRADLDQLSNLVDGQRASAMSRFVGLIADRAQYRQLLGAEAAGSRCRKANS